MQVLLEAFALQTGLSKIDSSQNHKPFGEESPGEEEFVLAEEQVGGEDIAAAREHMLFCLEQMRRSGVELFVDGHAALPTEAVSKAVREDSPYMADYVFDAEGVIEQVRFDRVTRR